MDKPKTELQKIQTILETYKDLKSLPLLTPEEVERIVEADIIDEELGYE